MSRSNKCDGTLQVAVAMLLLLIVASAPFCGLDEACLTEERLRLDRLPATGLQNFLPLTAVPPFLAEQQSSSGRPPQCSGLSGAVRSSPVFATAIEAAKGAARNKERNMTMATIGTFTANENGFTGSIRTLALNVKARIARIENPSDKGPHFRIYAGAVELGAAWQKRSEQTDRDYLSVKLDDPSFPAPIYATLTDVEGEDGFQLIWSRPNRD